MYCGVDEAGKGPVLGSMFVAAVRAHLEELPDDITDSKQLSPSARELLAEKLHNNPNIDIDIAEVTPEMIDGENLNELTVVAHGSVLETVAADGDTCICDAADVNASRFAARIRTMIGSKVEIQAKHRADETEQIVGAASIVAKSAREAHVADLSQTFGQIGSGYPSDPITRSFLREYVAKTGALPECARRSWQTSQDVLDAAAQASLEDF